MHDHGETILYAADRGPGVEVRLERDTVWLTQKQMALLFNKDSDTISLHLRNVYEEGELEETATSEESSLVQKEGARSVRRRVKVYNLDAIISVGYRVNSKSGVQFRQMIAKSRPPNTRSSSPFSPTCWLRRLCHRLDPELAMC